VGVLKAAEGQPEVIEPVRQRGAGDRHAGAGHVGEVGQTHPARLVGLAEDHLPLRAVQRAPLADAPLQRPPDPEAQLGMPPHQLLEDGDGSQTGTRLQHWDDLGIEDGGQGIGPPPLAKRALIRRRPRVLRDAVAGGGAESGAGGGDGDRGVRAMLHEEPHLVIGHVAAGHERSSKAEKAPTYPDRPQSPRRSRTSGWVTPFLRFGIGASLSSRLPRASHPDRRAADPYISMC
jgi:hypothetical protein